LKGAKPELLTPGPKSPDLGDTERGVELHPASRASTMIDFNPEIRGWIDLQVDLVLAANPGLMSQIKALIRFLSPSL